MAIRNTKANIKGKEDISLRVLNRRIDSGSGIDRSLNFLAFGEPGSFKLLEQADNLVADGTVELFRHTGIDFMRSSSIEASFLRTNEGVSEARPCILALYIFFMVVSQCHTFELDLIIQKPTTHRTVESLFVEKS
jgi:hypothetical protein